MPDINWSDTLYKAFWTLIAALAGFAATGNLVEYWWGPVVTAAATIALAFARQRLGATPPTLTKPAK